MLPHHLAQIQAVLAGHPELELAVVFGSVARGEAGPESDLDIGLCAARPLTLAARMGLIEDLAVATGRPIDLVDLATVGEPLLGQIVTKGEQVLGTPERFARLIYKHWIEEADFLPLRRRILAERQAAWTKS